MASVRRWISRVVTAGALITPVMASRPADAQVPSALDRLTKSSGGVSTLSASSANPWLVGAQLGVRFAGSGDLADNLLGSGLVKYEIRLDSTVFHLPVYSNIGALAAMAGKTKADSLKAAASALLGTAQGMSVGLYPYWDVPNVWKGNMLIVPFAQVVAKANTMKGRPSLTAPDTAKKIDYTLVQGRVAGGLEFVIGKGDADKGDRPLTVSYTLSGTTFDSRTYELIFGDRRKVQWGHEVTAIIPVQAGAGLLIEGVGSAGHSAVFRLGMILAGAKGVAPSSNKVGANAGVGATLPEN